MDQEAVGSNPALGTGWVAKREPPLEISRGGFVLYGY